jgi:aspartate aminotransferase-like enzyme|uniref:Alanine--glyoxylate aminotransferase family protein n=1 Tax=candidate division WOR-3 bacterium TaxID=2052148 RepID=A0A7V3PUN0_UNCW3
MAIKPQYKLWTPGPVAVPRAYLHALEQDLVYHRDELFGKLLTSVVKGLQQVFLTKRPVYILTASGTGAMESAVANLVNPGERVIVAHAGKFGERWREINIRFGAYVDELARPYGESIPPEELERKLKSNDAARCVFTTLTETSTGVTNDIRTFGEICYRLNRILIVDAIAGLGIDELQMDAWHVDVVIGGSQKGLACPPGLAFIAVSEKAWVQVEKCRNNRFYFDLRQYQKFAEKGQTPWTPAISLFYALDLALRKVTRKGIKKNWQEKAVLGKFVRSEVEKMGLAIFPQHPSNALTVIKMPEGIDGTKIVDYCKRVHRILISNGQAELRGKVVRIGHMAPTTKSEMKKVLRYFNEGYRKLVVLNGR